LIETTDKEATLLYKGVMDILHDALQAFIIAGTISGSFSVDAYSIKLGRIPE
jgi:hypothetical protein